MVSQAAGPAVVSVLNAQADLQPEARDGSGEAGVAQGETLDPESSRKLDRITFALISIAVIVSLLLAGFLWHTSPRRRLGVARRRARELYADPAGEDAAAASGSGYAAFARRVFRRAKTPTPAGQAPPLTATGRARLARWVKAAMQPGEADPPEAPAPGGPAKRSTPTGEPGRAEPAAGAKQPAEVKRPRGAGSAPNAKRPAN